MKRTGIWFKWWICVWVLCIAPLAHASFNINEGRLPITREVWVDKTAQATIDDAQTQTYAKPVAEVISRGYHAGATWVRVTVPPTAEDNLWVTVQPMYLDNVQLYTQAWFSDGTRGPWAMRQGGDRMPFADKERPTLLNSFALEASASAPTVFYLRVRTSSTHAIFVNVRSQASALNFEGVLLLGLGVFVGVVAVLMVLAAVRWWVTRDGLWASNIVYQMGSIVIVLAYLGVPHKFFWPTAPQGVDMFTSVVFCGHLALSVLYYAHFTVAFKGSRWMVGGYLLSFLPFPFLLWLIVKGQAGQALGLNSLVMLFSTFVGMMAWSFKIEDKPLRWTVRFIFYSQTVYLLYFTLPLFGLAPMTQIHLYPAAVASLYGAVLQFVVLTRRDQLAVRVHRQVEMAMLTTEHTLRAREQQLSESTGFLNMLLHELKNPLAAIRMAVANLQRHTPPPTDEQRTRLGRIQAAAEDMDRVLNRCRMVDRLESGRSSLQLRNCDAVGLVHQAAAGVAEPQRLVLDLPEHLMLHTDSDWVVTMASNLIDNALAYSPTGSAVAVALAQVPAVENKPAHLRLTVANTVGRAGLPEPDKLFEKYYRAPGALHLSGTGLGLYLVRSLARQLGGDVRYEAPTHEQVVFELWLPLTESKS